MQPPDAPTAFLFKLWPWIETNKSRVITGTVILLVAIFVYSFFSWHGQQKEIAAGRAITQLLLTAAPGAGEGQWADGFLKIARQYPGTPAGKRAWLQGAMALFTAGRFADAQAQFQKILDTYPDSDFSASAALGAGASLEALGKLDAAASAYQQVINGFSSDLVAATTAKFALARIDGQQGKISDALNLYDSIARTSPAGPVGQEAMLRAMELRTKLATATTAPGQP